MYSGAVAIPHAVFGEGLGLIFLDDTSCTGNETRLEQCGHLGIGASNCFHDEDVSVVCAGGCGFHTYMCIDLCETCVTYWL